VSYQGHIERGMVVFDEPISLPEGTEVVVEPVAPPRATSAAREDFWRERSIEELLAEQQVSSVRRWHDVLGQGKTLWEDDGQFDEFLRSIYDRRREGISS
jgi:hypothetical protein